ncbi:MAG: DUF1553 domain-containing protein, partial [Verrucomicrobiota bacterium]
FFGMGLVKTGGDFGIQGEPPSHPELLDWLASDFIASGWDVKRLQRMIVSSAAYRQASRHRVDLHDDPENRLLGRAPRFRLSAEGVRDTALVVSGLLNREIGGPSVKPHQPEGYLSSIGKQWKESSGPQRHRRGLYTFWRRTMLYPSYQIFDAPSREFCSVDRPRTNTPLQALVTLNDPAFVEAARHFGFRMMEEGGETDAARLRFGFQLATSRKPGGDELDVLQKTLAEQRQQYGQDLEGARAFIGSDERENAGERAAWAALGNILLNLDETITRE